MLLNQPKINITSEFEHVDVLEIQDISCKKMCNFLPFWVPFDTYSPLKNIKKLQYPIECVTASNVTWKNYLVAFVAFVGYYERDRQFMTLLDLYLTLRVPQNGSQFVICPQWVRLSNLWWEIISLCKFAASLGLQFFTLFDPYSALKWVITYDLFLMSDIKSLVRNYFSVQICNFWWLQFSTHFDP